VLAAVAALALPASQTPPPSIAEFAPQAQEQITDAPDAQTSESGEGPGSDGGGPGTGTTTTLPSQQTTTTLPPVERPRTNRCVGTPPRQTEDPQSPPCIAFFEGDNGGATSKGVTANEIRVVVPTSFTFAEDMAAHFNTRYELYGRSIRVIPLDKSGDMIADAIAADQEHDAFASLLYGDAGGQESVYYDELARRGIVSANGNPSSADEADLAAHHPFQWSYLPTYDVMARAKADWVCSSLKGKQAVHAGGQEQTRQRAFAVVRTVEPNGAGPDVTPLLAGLDGCGIDVGEVLEMVRQSGDDAAGLRQAQDVVLKLRTRGITSVICECHTQSSGFYLYPQSTSQGYFPEWLFGTYMYQAEDTHVQLYADGAQMEHTFGHGWWSKQLPPEQSPWFAAIKEGEPAEDFSEAGGPPFSYYDARFLYNSFLILASGIQLAGPNLTPDSFAKGLQLARFPNPGAGAAPHYQGTVSFAGDHSAIEDVAVVWASKGQRSSWGGAPGAICYSLSGTRYRLGRFPAETPVYQGACY
jgi:hypothetical protein